MTIELLQYDDSGNTPTNIESRFAGMTTAQIREVMDSDRSPMVNVCMNLTSDFNKSSVIRAHSAFLGSDVYIVGKRRYDRRGTVGAHHYVPIFHSETLAPVVDKLHEDGYTVFAVDNTPEFNPVPVYDAALPAKSAFIYGEEQAGLSVDDVALCDSAIYIPMYGGVPRSLNVAQAAAVMMGEYCRRHRF